MKFVLVSSVVPFINGGGRFIVEWLEEKLKERGHEVERFYIPFADTPHDLLEQIAAFRLIDLSGAGDRLIAFRPPAYVIQHPHKMLWFIHHIRVFYDLWGSEHAPPDTPASRALRDALTHLDTVTIKEARKVFTNSQVVSDRLQTFNGIASEPLYPPIFNPERFHHDRYTDEILVINRVEPHKRPMLMVEAMAHVKTPVRLRLCGTGHPGYADSIRQRISEMDVAGRIAFEDCWISDEDKVDRLARALAVAYVPIDEDGVGYPSMEAAYARKAVITTTDAGAALELVIDGENGFVAEPEPAAIAAVMDRLYLDRTLAQRCGDANLQRLAVMGIDWDRVVEAFAS